MSSEDSNYTEQELSEIEAFLRENYFKTAELFPAARPRDSERTIGPEIQRLRQTKRGKGKDVLSPDDLEQLETASASGYASEFSGHKADVVLELKRKLEVHPSAGKDSAGLIFLRNASRRLCARHKGAGITGISISTGGLTVLMHHLGLDPVYAPVVVWFATKIRDYGLPVLCDSLKEYFAGEVG